MFYTFLLTYLLGGLTFFPLLLAIAATCLYFNSTPVDHQGKPSNRGKSFSGAEGATQGDRAERADSSNPELSPPYHHQDELPDLVPELPRLYRAGWLTVRQSYELSSSSESGYMGLITNSYRNFIDNRSNQAKRTRAKDHFYSVLKQNVLFLYPDQDQVECTAAIKVSLYQVDLYPTGCPDPELFVKRKAISLTPVNHASTTDQPFQTSPTTPENHYSDHVSDHQPASPSPWFIFTKNNLEKEDWYHLLLAASKLSQPDSRAIFQKDTSLFDPQDMAKLVEGIDRQPDPIPMRWMNAILGRLFLSAYRTYAFENWIIDRIMKKLTKVQTPSFLSAINVREVHVGSTTPFFSKPMLKELTVNGDASMEVLVNYQGQFRITIETVATINLGARFKPYVVNLVLAVVLKELSGTLLLKIKRPPTNRLWFGFTTMPHLILDLQPVVSTRQIKWALVLKPIESRIREVVMESLVYPNLDDLVFFDTQPYAHHGGIWGDAARKENSANETRDDQASDSPANVEETKPKSHPSSSSHQDSHHQPDPPHPPKTPLSRVREDGSRSHDTLRLRTKSSSLGNSSADSIIASEPSDSHSTPLVNQSETKRSSWFSSARRQDTSSTQSSQHLNRHQPKSRSVAQESSDLEDGDAVSLLQKFLRSHPEASTSSSPLPTPPLEGKSPTPNPLVSQPTRSSPLSEPLEIDFGAHNDALSNKPVHAEPSQSVDGPPDQKDSASNPSSTKGISNHSKDTPSLRSVPPPPPQSLPASFLPPPQRTVQPMRSTDLANNQPSNGSILNQLRTRATDKEAIAASVTQARDVVMKWGASWASKRKSPQSNHMYPYNSGFNPIRIDEVDQIQDSKPLSTLTADAPDQTNSSSDSTDTTNKTLDTPHNVLTQTREEEINHQETSKPYRAQKAVEKSHNLVLPSSPLSKSNFTTAPSFQEEVSFDDELSKQEKQESCRNSKPSSILPIANLHSVSEESHPGAGNSNHNSNGKRNRIFSSNGQFVPPAPQSTTGLSILSSPRSEALVASNSNNNSNTNLVPMIHDVSALNASASKIVELKTQDSRQRNTSSPTGKKSEILSERSSYQPAPMMAIPGIKDSSHRFGLGSDSISKLGLSQQQHPPFLSTSRAIEHPATSSDTGLGSPHLNNNVNSDPHSIDRHSNDPIIHPSSPQYLQTKPQPPPSELTQLKLNRDDEQGKQIIEEGDSSAKKHEESKSGEINDDNEALGDRDSNFGLEKCNTRTGHDDHDQMKQENSEINDLEISDHDKLNPLPKSSSSHSNSTLLDNIHIQDKDQNEIENGTTNLMDSLSDSPVDHLAWGF